MKELIENIVTWGKERELIKYEYRYEQLAKVIEEVGELAAAMIRDDFNAQADAIGDVATALILLSNQLGIKYENCVAMAYGTIKDRRGIFKNRSYIKEEDL